MKLIVAWFNHGGMELDFHAYGISAVDNLVVSRILELRADNIIDGTPQPYGRHEQIVFPYTDQPNSPVVQTEGHEAMLLFRDTPVTGHSECVAGWWTDLWSGDAPKVDHVLFVSQLLRGLAMPDVVKAVEVVRSHGAPRRVLGNPA